MRTVDHFINGSSHSSAGRASDIFDPSQGSVQASVGLGTAADLQRAVAAAQAAQPGWAATNPQRRARVMFDFKALVEANMDELAHLLSSEHGKVIADAKGDIQRGLEVIEFACGIPHVLKGEYTQGAGPGHRRLFDAPAARHRRGDHPVQLPGDDPDVDVRRRDRAAATPSSSSRPSATRRCRCGSPS